MIVPPEIETERLVLRPWRVDDAQALHPILETNWDHLGPWIPARVATPASIPILVEGLSGFAREFEGEREWRYALLRRADSTLLGELSLFPRSATARTPFGDSASRLAKIVDPAEPEVQLQVWTLPLGNTK